MRRIILALAFLIASSASFADDLALLSLEPLTRKNLPDYKSLLRYFAQEDQGTVSEYSMAHLTAHEEEIDTLAELGLYEIPTLFTD